jgi:hypothetical protein
MDPYHHRPHRDKSRVTDALDRLAELAAVDERIRCQVYDLAEYHESEAAQAYPLFDLAEISEVMESIVADDPELAIVIAFVATADASAVACIMAAIKQRIDEFTNASVTQ